MKPKHSLLLLLAASCLSGCTGDMIPNNPEDPATEAAIPGSALPGIIRIKIDRSLEDSPQSLDLSALGNCTIKRSIPEGSKYEDRYRKSGMNLWYNVQFDSSLPMTKAASSLFDIPGICEIAYIQKARPDAAFEFDDPYFSSQWHYFNNGIQSGTAAGSDINLLPAWEVTTGSPNVIVAICDSAPEYSHEDLAENMWVNEAEANGTPGVDDDGNGYVDDVNGYNFVVAPYYGSQLVPGDHGTHIAGTIAAVNNNGTGVCGIAGGNGQKGSGARLMSIQTSNGDNAAYIGEAIIYAANNGAVLMNCSWSIESNDSYINDCIDYFNTYAGIDENGNQTGPMAGGVCIFAAGNESSTISYPAMNDNVIAVAATGPDFGISSYSNYGNWVDISAPGGDAQKGFQIYSTLTAASGKYGYMQGTSMACPHVTGVAALIVSHYGGPGFTRDQMINILLDSANPVLYDHNPSYNGMLGSGMVDAGAAVSGSTELPEPADDLNATAKSNTITLEWTIHADGRGTLPYSYDIYYSDNTLDNLDPDNPSEDVHHMNFVPESGQKDGDRLSYNFSGLVFDTKYHFRIRTRNMFGGLSALSEQVSCTTQGNTAPEITALDVTALALKSHETGQMHFRLSDADGHSLTYRLMADEGSNLDGASASLSEDGTLTLRINALAAEEGSTHYGFIEVSDSYETSRADFSYSVAENHSPAAKAADNLVLNSRRESISFSLSDIFSDEDGEDLNYDCSISTTNIIVRCSITGDRLNIDANSYGSTEVTVTATDARGKSASTKFEVLVRDGSRQVDLYPNPVVDILNIRTGEEATASITITNRAGANVYSADNVQISPFSPVQVDMDGLPGGVYYVNVSGNSLNSTYSIAKQ